MPDMAGIASGAFNVVRLLGDILAALMSTTLKQTADAFGDELDDRLTLGCAGSLHMTKHRRIGAISRIHAVEKIMWKCTYRFSGFIDSTGVARWLVPPK
jgi:hypothetical protein